MEVILDSNGHNSILQVQQSVPWIAYSSSTHRLTTFTLHQEVYCLISIWSDRWKSKLRKIFNSPVLSGRLWSSAAWAVVLLNQASFPAKDSQLRGNPCTIEMWLVLIVKALALLWCRDHACASLWWKAFFGLQPGIKMMSSLHLHIYDQKECFWNELPLATW